MWGYFMIYSEISTNNNMIWFCLTMAEFTRLHSVEIIILVAANMKIDDIGAHTFRQTRRPKSRNIFEVPHAVPKTPVLIQQTLRTMINPLLLRHINFQPQPSYSFLFVCLPYNH